MMTMMLQHIGFYCCEYGRLLGSASHSKSSQDSDGASTVNQYTLGPKPYTQ